MLELYKSKSKIVGMTKEHSILQYVLFFFRLLEFMLVLSYGGPGGMWTLILCKGLITFDNHNFVVNEFLQLRISVETASELFNTLKWRCPKMWKPTIIQNLWCLKKEHQWFWGTPILGNIQMLSMIIWNRIGDWLKVLTHRKIIGKCTLLIPSGNLT